MPLAEQAIRRTALSVWNHYSMCQDGIATLTELGYTTCEGKLAAFWVDVFTHTHILFTKHKAESKS